MRQLGPAREVADAYVASVDDREIQAKAAEPSPGLGGAATRTGSGEIRVTAVEVLDEASSLAPVLMAGQPCTFRLHYRGTGRP